MFRIEEGRIVDGQGSVLFAHARCPVGFFARLRGLIGRPLPVAGEAWWFARCSAIHTLAMRGPIDVLHLDAEGRILACRPRLRSCRVSALFGSRYVVELAAGAIAAAGLVCGQPLRFES